MKKTKKIELRAKTKAATTEGGVKKRTRARTGGGDTKPKRISAMDAAAQILTKAKSPMSATGLIAAMAEQGLWKSPGGATPAATLNAALHREIATKGAAARFKKVERGLFAIRP